MQLLLCVVSSGTTYRYWKKALLRLSAIIQEEVCILKIDQLSTVTCLFNKIVLTGMYCGLDCSYRSQISNMCEIQPICSHIGCNVQCTRLFSCELMTFLMDHEHDVFDKSDKMPLILFSRVRNG